MSPTVLLCEVRRSNSFLNVHQRTAYHSCAGFASPSIRACCLLHYMRSCVQKWIIETEATSSDHLPKGRVAKRKRPSARGRLTQAAAVPSNEPRVSNHRPVQKANPHITEIGKPTDASRERHEAKWVGEQPRMKNNECFSAPPSGNIRNHICNIFFWKKDTQIMAADGGGRGTKRRIISMRT